MSVTVIAEPGACHDGSLQVMLSMLESAIAAGADMFKPQFWSDADQLADRRNATPEYRDIYRRYQLPAHWLPILKAEAGGRIRLACTVYLPQDVAFVAPFVSALKVSSFEAMDWAMVAAAVRAQLPLVVSTGMCSHAEVRTLRARLDTAGAAYQLLHCVSAYPTPLSECQLRVIGVGVTGFSDHTDPSDLISGAVAVGAGATIIEAHLRDIGTSAGNPDAPHAMSAQAFRVYVQFIRQASQMMGTSATKQAQPSEGAMLPFRMKGPQ